MAGNPCEELSPTGGKKKKKKKKNRTRSYCTGEEGARPQMYRQKNMIHVHVTYIYARTCEASERLIYIYIYIYFRSQTTCQLSAYIYNINAVPFYYLIWYCTINDIQPTKHQH